MTPQVIELPVWDTIQAAWARVSGSKAAFWCSFLIFFVIMAGLGTLENLTDNNQIVSGLIKLIANILAYLLQFGLLYMGIMRAKDLPIKYQMLFQAFDLQLVLYLIGLYVLQLVIFMAPTAVGVLGVILYLSGNMIGMSTGVILIIGAIFAFAILGIRMSLSMGFIMDMNMAPLASIKASLKATQRNFWNILAIFILQWVFMMISMIPLGIGMIWSLPFMFICYGLMYKVLRGNVVA